MSKVATLQNLWVPDPAKVGRSRFRSAEIDVFRPNSWTKTSVGLISTTYTQGVLPPANICNASLESCGSWLSFGAELSRFEASYKPSEFC